MATIQGIRPNYSNAIFSKGMIDAYWNSNMPPEYTPYCRNIRLENWSTIIRKWFSQEVASVVGSNMKGLQANHVNDNLYAVFNKNFYVVDFTNDEYDIYMFAVLTGWASATAWWVTWTAVTDWEFAITIDWTAYDVTALDFSSTTDEDWIAAVIQVGIRAETSSTETVVRSTNKFIITSVDTSSATEVSVTSAVSWGAGTDISGAWGTAFMDCETGRGTATAPIEISTTDTVVNMISYDKYTIILNGETYPLVYDWTTLTQLWAGAIEADANPLYGAVFADFTYVSGTGTKSTQLYISKPIVATAITDCYDWADATADIRTMRSNILWLVGTMNRLVVFCEDSIEYLDRSTVATVWGSSVFYTKPIATGDKLASHRSIVAAGDAIFFLTKDVQVKTVSYVEWTVEMDIGELSEDDWKSISLFMSSLDRDQSDSFGYYNKNEGLIKWRVKSNWAIFNDTCLVYDLIAQTWLVDDNKYFSCAAEYDKKYYCGSDLNTDLLQDEVDYDDDWEGIARERRTNDNSFGDPLIRKSFRGATINWQISTLGEIFVEWYVDWIKVTDTFTISWSAADPGILGWWVIWGAEIWAEPIGGEVQQVNLLRLSNFNKKVGKGKLRTKGKRIQRRYYGNKINTLMSLDGMWIDFRGIWDTIVKNKL